MGESVERHPRVIQKLPLPVLLQVDLILVSVEMDQVPAPFATHKQVHVYFPTKTLCATCVCARAHAQPPARARARVHACQPHFPLMGPTAGESMDTPADKESTVPRRCRSDTLQPHGAHMGHVKAGGRTHHIWLWPRYCSMRPVNVDRTSVGNSYLNQSRACHPAPHWLTIHTALHMPPKAACAAQAFTTCSAT